jgi:hypothetical protein
MRLLRARGHPAEREVPFGALAQLLRPTSSDLDGIPAPQAQALGVALALRSGPAVDRLAIGAAVLSLLTRYCEDRPVAVLVDDAHQLDRPSAEALGFACRRLLADPVLVVVAARPDPSGPLTDAGLPSLAVPGLEPEAIADLVRSRGGHPTTEAIAAMHRVSGGNPLAVLELARDPSRLPSIGPGLPMPVPARPTRWFGQRVTALGAQARTVLLLVATTGGDLAVVSRACHALGVDVRVVADAERAGLVEVRTDQVDFVHPLVRAAVYAIAEPAERRALHAAAAAAVPQEDVDRRAWHRCEAALGLDDVVAAEMAALARRADRAARTRWPRPPWSVPHGSAPGTSSRWTACRGRRRPAGEAGTATPRFGCWRTRSRWTGPRPDGPEPSACTATSRLTAGTRPGPGSCSRPRRRRWPGPIPPRPSSCWPRRSTPASSKGTPAPPSRSPPGPRHCWPIPG